MQDQACPPPLCSGSGLPRSSTERVGFEPTVHMVNTRSPGVPIQPLSHLSQVHRVTSNTTPTDQNRPGYEPAWTESVTDAETVTYLPADSRYATESQHRIRTDNLTSATYTNNRNQPIGIKLPLRFRDYRTLWEITRRFRIAQGSYGSLQWPCTGLRCRGWPGKS